MRTIRIYSALIDDLSHAMSALDADTSISALVLTGSEKAFAAGADIKEMAPKSYMDNFLGNWLSNWGVISKTRKPVIAGMCVCVYVCVYVCAMSLAVRR